HDGCFGLGGGDGLQSAPSALGFAANGQVGLLIDEVRQPLAHERMIVHEEHFSFRFGGVERHGGIWVGGCKFAADEGSEHSTEVPPIGLGSMENVPPIMAARWAIMRVPRPRFF